MITCKNCDNNLNKNGYFCKCGLTGEAHSDDYTCDNSVGSMSNDSIIKLIDEIINKKITKFTSDDYNDSFRDFLFILKERLKL